MFEKVGNVLALILNLGVFIFMLVGANYYVPDATGTFVLNIIGFGLLIYGLLSIGDKIVENINNKKMEQYIKENFKN